MEISDPLFSFICQCISGTKSSEMDRNNVPNWGYPDPKSCVESLAEMILCGPCSHAPLRLQSCLLLWPPSPKWGNGLKQNYTRWFGGFAQSDGSAVMTSGLPAEQALAELKHMGLHAQGSSSGAQDKQILEKKHCKCSMFMGCVELVELPLVHGRNKSLWSVQIKLGLCWRHHPTCCEHPQI